MRPIFTNKILISLFFILSSVGAQAQTNNNDYIRQGEYIRQQQEIERMQAYQRQQQQQAQEERLRQMQEDGRQQMESLQPHQRSSDIYRGGYYR